MQAIFSDKKGWIKTGGVKDLGEYTPSEHTDSSREVSFLLKYGRQLKQLIIDLKSHTDQLEILRPSHNKRLDERKKLQSRIDSLNKQKGQLEKEFQSRSNWLKRIYIWFRLRDIRDSLSDSQEHLDNLSKEIKTKEKELKDIEIQISSINKEIKAISKKREELKLEK